jgi:hypothetical protein
MVIRFILKVEFYFGMESFFPWVRLARYDNKVRDIKIMRVR